jgi:type IX secretion system PorP/SprF family membrane protein
MKKAGWFFSILISHLFAYGQNDVFLSHQLYLPTYYNPSALGAEQIGSLSFAYRNQWTGYVPTSSDQGGAPKTQMLSLVIPASNLPISGIGINVITEQLGPINNFQAQFSTSAKFKVGYGTLNIGIMPGIYSKTLGSVLDANDPSDSAIPTKKETQINFNLGGGALYVTSNGLFLGISIVNALEPNFDFGLSQASNAEKRTFVFHGGKKYQLNDKIGILPNFNLRSNFTGLTADFGTMIYYNDRLWTGVAYRKEEAIIFYLGYSLLQNKLRVGYSFDYVVKNQNAKSPTSSEVYLKYNLPDLVLGGKKTIKTPRFVF